MAQMQKNGSKIAYICLQSTQEGTAGYAHVHEIINGLEATGWRVRLFECRYGADNPSPGALARILVFIRLQIMFLLTLSEKWQALYFRSHFALFPVALVAKILRIPVIQEVNGPYEDFFTAWPVARRFKVLIEWLIRKQYAMADAVITVTPQLKKWVMQETGIGPDAIFVIPNGANVNIFHPQSVSKVKHLEPYVVFFGALSHWQGVDTMLDAVKMPQWPDDLNLVIVGDGQDRQKVQEFCKHHSKVKYLGKLPYHQLPGIVANAVMGLIPKSARFGHTVTGLFPLKLFEMAACGIPVIVSDFAGQADFVREYACGRVVPPDRPDDLVNAVEKLYKETGERNRMGSRGREAVVSSHSWMKRASDTGRVIRNAMLSS